MAISEKAWDGSAAKYSDTAAYCRACLIDDNPAGKAKTQDNCKLPINEPNGDINKNALAAAAAALAGARGGIKGTSAESKKKAAKALLRAYHEAKMEPPDSLKQATQ